MQNKSWKKYVFSLVLLIFAFVLVACGNGANDGGNGTDTGTDTGTETETDDEAGTDTDTSDGEPVEIEFWSFWGGGARRETIEAIIEDFNNSQDRIQVSHVYQPWGDIWTKSLAAVTAGNPPNIVVQDINTVRQRADAQQATNLQSYLDEEDEEIESRFYPQLWDTVIFEDEAYGLPFNTDTQVLFYNKDMFEESGLDPEAPPATWAELEEYARQLDDGSGNDWNTIGFYPLWNLGADVWALNADGGVSWFDEEGNVTINTPAKIDALEWILEWQDYYGVDTINQYQAEFGSGVTDPFISGLIPIRGQNINYYTNLLENAPDDFNFGVAQLPEYEEGNGHWSWGGGFVLEIPYGAEHPDESFEFMQYLTSTEVQERFGLASFDIMANAEANENLVTHPDLDEEGQMIYELAHLNLEETLITPVPLTAPDFIPLVNGQIDEALLGNKSAEEALNDAQASVESLVEQNQ